MRFAMQHYVGQALKHGLHQDGVDIVVLDVENTLGRGVGCDGQRSRLDVVGCAWGYFSTCQTTHVDPKTAATTFAGLHPDVATHGQHQSLAQGQTNACTFDLSRRHAHALEGCEEPTLLLGRETRAVVVHEQSNLVAPQHALHDHFTTRLVVFDGVGQEVEQHLFEPGRVGQHEPLKTARGERLQVNATGLSQGLHHVQTRLHQVPERDLRGLNREVPGFD